MKGVHKVGVNECKNKKVKLSTAKHYFSFYTYFRELVAQFHMEVGYICHTFFNYKLAHEHLMAAKKCTGLQISLTGKLCKGLHENFVSKIIKVCISNVFFLYFLANYTLTAFLLYYFMFIKFCCKVLWEKEQDFRQKTKLSFSLKS